jgi:hypothetical protein
MVRFEDIARVALAYEALAMRDLIQDLLRERPDWAAIPRPVEVSEETLVVAAALLELLALRGGAEPPGLDPRDRPGHGAGLPRTSGDDDAAHSGPRGSREPRAAAQTQRIRPRRVRHVRVAEEAARALLSEVILAGLGRRDPRGGGVRLWADLARVERAAILGP